MPMGGGKYDEELNELVAKLKPKDIPSEFGVMLVVLGGPKGTGFSVAGNVLFLAAIPSALRFVASQIESDTMEIFKNLKVEGKDGDTKPKTGTDETNAAPDAKTSGG